MDNQKFIDICKKIVKQYAMEHLDKSDIISEFEVFVVWLNKTLQNNKALLSTTLSDGMYYELTYNGDKKELYLDAYKKFENRCIKIEYENESFIDRLFKEQEELNIKINKLNSFLGSDKYVSLSTKQQELLVEQFNAMNEYKRTLNERTALILQDKENNNIIKD